MATIVTRTAHSALRRFIRAIEPWYDWGNTYIENMADESEGPGKFIALQWLGISLTLFYGRTPKREAL